MGHSLCSFILRQIPRRSPTHNAVYFTTTRLGGYTWIKYNYVELHQYKREVHRRMKRRAVVLIIICIVGLCLHFSRLICTTDAQILLYIAKEKGIESVDGLTLTDIIRGYTALSGTGHLKEVVLFLKQMVSAAIKKTCGAPFSRMLSSEIFSHCPAFMRIATMETNRLKSFI